MYIVGLGGFGIRFTVQFNLFAGSILGLGGPQQLEELSKMQDLGQLGCFLLTENQAGVLSGLIVKTTAEWNKQKGCFVLHTPDDKAAKNWISQVSYRCASRRTSQNQIMLSPCLFVLYRAILQKWVW